jgi:putative thioredoxin
MGLENIIDVSETDFEYEVVKYSLNNPVVVDFWADWCQPCKILSPMLEQLTIEAGGSFRLAKVDTDSNPNLALQFGIRSLPTVKAFLQGQVVAEFVGAQPRARVQEFLGKLAPPSPITLALEKAYSILKERDWKTAEFQFKEILSMEPNQNEASLGLAMSMLGQGNSIDSYPIIRNFPASKLFAQAEKILPLAEVLEAFRLKKLTVEDDLDIAFENCIRLAARGNIPASLDGLLEVIKQSKHYRNDIARQVFLALLELLGSDTPQARQYRSELATALF